MGRKIEAKHVLVTGILLFVLAGGWLYFSDIRNVFDNNPDVFYILEDRLADNGQLRVTTRGPNYEVDKDLLFWRYGFEDMTLYKNQGVLVKSKWLVKGYGLKRTSEDVLSYDGNQEEAVVDIFRNRSYSDGFFEEHTVIDSVATFEQFPSDHLVTFVSDSSYKRALTWRLDRVEFPVDLGHGKYYGCRIDTLNSVKIDWCSEKSKVNYAFVDLNRKRLSVYFKYVVGDQKLNITVVDPPDVDPPTTTSDANSNVWQNFDANVILSCVDNNTGCASTQYRKDINTTDTITFQEFQIVDDFEDGNFLIDPAWTLTSGTANITVQNVIVKNDVNSLKFQGVNTGRSHISTNLVSDGNIYSAWIYSEDAVESEYFIEQTDGTDIAQLFIENSLGNVKALGTSCSGGSCLSTNVLSSVDLNKWYKLEAEYVDGSTSVIFRVYDENGSLINSVTDTAIGAQTVGRLSIGVVKIGSDDIAYFDDVTYGGTNWGIFDQNILFNQDGNFVLDFNSTDNIGNIETTNREFVLIDKTVPVLSDVQPSSNQNTGDTTPDLNVAFTESNPSHCLVTPIVNDINQSDVNATLSGGRCLYTPSALNENDTIKAAFTMFDLAGNSSSELQTAIYTIIGDSIFGNVNENYSRDVNSPIFYPIFIVDNNVIPFGQNDFNGFWQLENIALGDSNVSVILRDRRVLDNFEQDWFKYKRKPLTDALLAQRDTNSFKGTYSIVLPVDSDLNFSDNNRLAIWINNQYTFDVNSEFNSGSDISIQIKVTDVSQIEDININIGNDVSNYVWVDLNQTRDSNLTDNTWFKFNIDMNLATETGSVNWADLDYFSIIVKEVKNNTTDINVFLDDLVISPTSNPINNWQNGTRFCIDDDNSSVGCLDLNVSSPALVVPSISNGESKKIWVWADLNLTGFNPFDLFEFDFNWSFGGVPTSS